MFMNIEKKISFRKAFDLPSTRLYCDYCIHEVCVWTQHICAGTPLLSLSLSLSLSGQIVRLCCRLKSLSLSIKENLSLSLSRCLSLSLTFFLTFFLLLLFPSIPSVVLSDFHQERHEYKIVGELVANAYCVWETLITEIFLGQGNVKWLRQI